METAVSPGRLRRKPQLRGDCPHPPAGVPGRDTMKLPFLRTAQHQDEPTVVAMTGVRRGDKVHFWGALPALLLPLAARSGLSGQVTVISPDAAELVSAAEREGLLVDSAPTPLPD